MTLDPALDLFPLLAGVLAAVSCGLLGNFLVLRRLSLMGDAISHSVLPGLVIAFIVTASRDPAAMFLGAALAGVATVVLVEIVKKLGRVEPGAAMGVVFSVLFALGVLLIEDAARQVDLDADCVLHGQLETLVWYDAPAEWSGAFAVETIRAAPRQVETLALVALLSSVFVIALFKELRLAAFDPALATTQGYHAGALHYALMILVAAATVASFEAVGSILVIAMLVCPAATARLLTDRLWTQVLASVGVAVASAAGGYAAATGIPAIAGKDSVNAAGSMAVAAGALLTAAILFSPRHGVIAKLWRHRALARRVAREDVVGALYRAHESGEAAVLRAALRDRLAPRGAVGLRAALRRGLVAERDGGLALTPAGRAEGEALVARHRLWERFLVDEAGLAPDHVHEAAERLEHLSGGPPAGPSEDPHGRRIPRAGE